MLQLPKLIGLMLPLTRNPFVGSEVPTELVGSTRLAATELLNMVRTWVLMTLAIGVGATDTPGKHGGPRMQAELVL